MSFSESLRALATWYDAHPEIPAPPDLFVNVFLDTKEDLQEVARALGDCTKGGDQNWFWLSRTFGLIRLDFNVTRSVACVRRVVGTEIVAEHVSPAYQREIVEWDCAPILETEAAP